MVLHGGPEFPLWAGKVLEVSAIRGLDSPSERCVLMVVRRHAVVVVVVMVVVVMWLLAVAVVVLHYGGRGGLVPEGWRRQQNGHQCHHSAIYVGGVL